MTESELRIKLAAMQAAVARFQEMVDGWFDEDAERWAALGLPVPECMTREGVAARVAQEAK